MSDAHPLEELPLLAAGALDLEDVRRMTRHLRRCESCRRELVEVVAGASALGLLEPADLAEPPAPAPLPIEAAPRRRRPLVLAVAAAVVAIALVAGAIALATRDSSDGEVAITLDPVGSAGAAGTVTMTRSGPDRTMTVDTTLAPAGDSAYYEVWLLHSQTGDVFAVGVLPEDGRAQFTVPATVAAAYDTVDVSLEPDDGNPGHGAASVLRATY